MDQQRIATTTLLGISEKNVNYLRKVIYQNFFIDNFVLSTK